MSAILETICSLIAKAKNAGASESEANAAMSMVAKLMKKNLLEESDIAEYVNLANSKKSGDIKLRTMSFNRKHLPEPIVNGLVVNLATFVTSKVFVSRNDAGVTLSVFGAESDFKVFEYLYMICERAAEAEYAKYAEVAMRFTKTHGRTLRKSFMLGMYNRLGKRLLEMKAAMEREILAETGTALVVLKEQTVEVEWKDYSKSLRLRTTQTAKPKIRAEAYYAGERSANAVQLNAAITA